MSYREGLNKPNSMPYTVMPRKEGFGKYIIVIIFAIGIGFAAYNRETLWLLLFTILGIIYIFAKVFLNGRRILR